METNKPISRDKIPKPRETYKVIRSELEKFKATLPPPAACTGDAVLKNNDIAIITVLCTELALYLCTNDDRIFSFVNEVFDLLIFTPITEYIITLLLLVIQQYPVSTCLKSAFYIKIYILVFILEECEELPTKCINIAKRVNLSIKKVKYFLIIYYKNKRILIYFKEK